MHHSNPPSVSKDTPVSRAPFLKYSGLLSDVFFPYTRVTLHSFAACSAGILFVCLFFFGGGGELLVYVRTVATAIFDVMMVED